MNVWLSSQAVARLTDLLAVVAAERHTGGRQPCQADCCRSRVHELMPASELLPLAGVLRQATDRPGLSAATRADCWSWSSYLEGLLGAHRTATVAITHPATRERPARNAVLLPTAAIPVDQAGRDGIGRGPLHPRREHRSRNRAAGPHLAANQPERPQHLPPAAPDSARLTPSRRRW